MRCRPRSIFPRSVPRRQPNARFPSLERRGLENLMSRRSPRPAVKRLRAGRGLGRNEGVRRPHLAARAHEGACQRRRTSAGLRTWFGHDPNRWHELHQRYFRSSAPITLQSSTCRILYRRVKSRGSSARTTPSATTPSRSRTTSRHTSRGRCSGSEARSSRRHSLPPAPRRRYRSCGCRR